MIDTTTDTRRARLLRDGGLHPLLAELIRSIDGLEARTTRGRLGAVLRARDAYLESILEAEES